MQHRLMRRLLIILMFISYHSWALSPVTTSILIWIWSQFFFFELWLQMLKNLFSQLSDALYLQHSFYYVSSKIWYWFTRKSVGDNNFCFTCISFNDSESSGTSVQHEFCWDFHRILELLAVDWIYFFCKKMLNEK